MKHVSKFVLKYRKIVLSIFIIASISCIFLKTRVKVNYNLTDYLPDNAKSTIALREMEEQYEGAIPNLRVYVPNISIPEALEYKEKLAKVDGVLSIEWLDDSVNINQPMETMDSKTVEAWYKNGGALYSVTVDEDKEVEALERIREVVGQEAALEGDAQNSVAAQVSSGEEINKIMLFVIPLILVIMLFTTRSWIEPFLFLITIGISIIINEGTNILFGEISFITQATGPILQLAVSMDYAIFLLNNFAEFRKTTPDVTEAMYLAMNKSFSSIASSAFTTLLGFLALVVMNFKIGPDMGLVLAKGIVFSLVSVLFFLPVLATYTTKWIDKTAHKSFVPSFEKFGKVAVKVGVPIMLIVVIAMVPSFLAQSNNDFRYGSSGMIDSRTKYGQDRDLINETFGKSTQVVLMVPKDNWAKEASLNQELKQVKEVSSIISYVNMVGEQIPVDFAGSQAEALISEKYSRILLTVNTEDEGEKAFEVVNKIKEITEKYFGEDYRILGGSVNNQDMKETVTLDNTKVNWLSIIAIGLVLLITFKSISLPIILVLTIEASIWINLAVPYFSGLKLNYIGYLIINTVQLGATVDYAILFTETYLENRKKMGKRKSCIQSITSATPSILTSGGILTLAGFMIGGISTNGVISQLGTLIGRGAILSVVMVLLFLPQVLMLLDKIIQKTTLGLKEVNNAKTGKA